jgi:nicotinate-nucleotide adenylyltransferase
LPPATRYASAKSSGNGSSLKIGIFGGTFDPVHLGHLIIAEEALALLGLDEVLFIPAGQPWFKSDRNITDGRHRMAMVELAIASNPCFRALDMEIKRPGPTYTVDTLKELRQLSGVGAEFLVILGLDSLREVSRWHEPQRILEMTTLVGMSRPGYQGFDPRSLDAIASGASCKVKLLEGPLIGISGTDLRRRIAEGRSIKYRVPEAVEAYIYEHGLYK